MSISLVELTATIPHVAPKINGRELGDTILKKSNGTEFCTILKEGLPLIDKLSQEKDFSSILTSHAAKLGCRGNTFTKLALSLCGRGEHGHNIGISSNKGLIPDSKTACKAVAKEGAVITLNLLKSEAAKLVKAAPKTRKRTVSSRLKEAVSK